MQNYRSDFPTLKKLTMLSSCSQSAMSNQALSAFQHYQESLVDSGMDWIEWMNVTNAAKQKFAELINCDVSEVAIMSSVSDCISSILHSLPLSCKDVVATDMDFPCIGQSMLAQQKKQDFEITFIPSKDGIIPLSYYKEQITDNTKLTCIPHISYYNGFKQDLKSVAEIAHRKGSLLFVDAYQSAGAVSIDVKDSGIDILVTGMQKYLLGIPGIAFMYVRKELAETLEPSTTGWFGQRDTFGFFHDRLEYGEAAQRFNTGTPPVVNAYVANSALEYILSIGTDKIERYLMELSEFTLAEAAKRELKVASPVSIEQKGPTTAIYCGNASKMEQLLKKEGLVLSARKDVIRLAPHLYSSKDDITKALDAIERFLPQTVDQFPAVVIEN